MRADSADIALQLSPAPTQESIRPRPQTLAAGGEKRAVPRTHRRSRAQLIPYPGGRHPHPIEVEVVDYSAIGIGILHTEGLLVGQAFIVREPFLTQDKTCIYRVIRSDRRDDDTFSIGLHVHNTMVDELDHYSSPPPPPLSARWKIWYLIYAVIGAATIVALAVLKQMQR
jgi:hypothetical protein